MTVLLIMLCVLVYVGAFENPHENSEYNTKRLECYPVESFLIESDHVMVFPCCAVLVSRAVASNRQSKALGPAFFCFCCVKSSKTP